MQKRWLERYNHQIGESEITAGCEQRFTPERCERINRAVPEVELGSMTHALSEASKRGDRRLRLGSSNGTISHPSSSTRRYRAGSDFAPLRARRTIPASSSEANQHPTTRLAQPECNQWTCRSLLDICLAGNSEFVISEDFVIATEVQDWHGGDLLLDCIHLFPIDGTSRPAKLRFERTDHRLSKRDSIFLLTFSARL